VGRHRTTPRRYRLRTGATAPTHPHHRVVLLRLWAAICWEHFVMLDRSGATHACAHGMRLYQRLAARG